MKVDRVNGAMRYLKYRWNEDRGDEHSDWGCSWWYFEVGENGYPVRQIEVYDSGIRLRYDHEHLEDEFGGLGCTNVNEFDRSADEELSAAEFETEWERGPWHNVGPRQ